MLCARICSWNLFSFVERMEPCWSKSLWKGSFVLYRALILYTLPNGKNMNIFLMLFLLFTPFWSCIYLFFGQECVRSLSAHFFHFCLITVFT